ncbi:MAG: AAA family ATPase [Chloroflexi bacterium]|nr:MAG: AAA family ATPase [Chloroflexota bacterium]
MKSILSACTPRQDILAGAFNPEIFTASISAVLNHYAGRGSGVHEMYTDAEQFFGECTYPTDGLKTVLSEVFARIGGDNSVPAIHRLETAFGGGKTHTLIACTHIGHRGRELAAVTGDVLSPGLLPEAGQVRVVGIAGDELPVHKPKGAKLIPYTLWGEIAYQIGGEALYRQVEDEAASYAAPARAYMDAVFGGRKVLLMIDELAQYAARLAAARDDGSTQLQAFLMTLLGYARTHSGMAVILTLASATDAFANQTRLLSRLLSDVIGKKIDETQALGIGQVAISSVASVVARDATAVVPVQAAEISRVLARRLFTRIDTAVAQDTAAAYAAMYRKNTSLLPDEATRADFVDRMVSHYPFHPTLIDFLNNKLSTSENFQGTRGVLRVLSLAVRNIWKEQAEIPMIHACHLNLKDARTVNEIVSRTGSGDLLPILNADIGGPDTEGVEGGRSNAELADERNPHPAGWPMYQFTWKTVFLHSLVGRGQGLQSNLFGLSEQDALFHVAFPELTPPQVAEALKEIGNAAFYLRFHQGRYYASLDPSINIALAKIRRTLSQNEIDQLLAASARKVVRPDVQTFPVVYDVSAPEHIPDKKGRPVLSIVSLAAGELDVDECVTTAGPNTPRIEQNLVFLLVPHTVHTRSRDVKQETVFPKTASPPEKAMAQLRDLARTVLAMRKLQQNPENYAIRPEKLDDEDFRERFHKGELSIVTAVTQSYANLWFPSADGHIVRKEIRTAGGEGGAPVIEQIRQTLIDDGELITTDQGTQSVLMNLRKLFFKRNDTVTLSRLRENFCRLRSWPILEAPVVLDQLVRNGVNRGIWCLFRIEDETSTTPAEFYGQGTGELPFDVDLSGDYAIVTPEGARKRGWTAGKGPDATRIRDWVWEAITQDRVATVSEIAEKVAAYHGDVPPKDLHDAVSKLAQEKRCMAYKGTKEQTEKPELFTGTQATFYMPVPEDVVITPKTAAERGWISKKESGLQLSGKKAVEILVPLLRRIGSLYQRGAKSTIDALDLVDLALPKGGTLRISLVDVPPESVRELGEFFEVAAGIVQIGDQTEAYLDVQAPDETCPLVQEIQKQIKKGR